MIVELTKQTNKALRWILKAAAKDEGRPILTGVNSNGSQVACDGFRIHAANVPMDDGTWNFGKVPARADVVKAEEVDVEGAQYTRYPDVFQIIPDANQEPVFEIGVSARYLGEAIEAMRGNRGLGFVRLKFYGAAKPMEVYGELADGVPGYALVMPIHLDRDTAKTAHNWRPARPVADGANA